MLLIHWNCVCLSFCLWSHSHFKQQNIAARSMLSLVVTVSSLGQMVSTPGNWLLFFFFPYVLKIFFTNISIRDQFSKYDLQSEVSALKSLRKVNLDKNHLAFVLCLIFTIYFFYTSVIYQLSSLSGRMFIPDVLEMIQFKWFIVGSGIFSKLFLRISFGQTYYTLKFNLWESFFFPLLFSSAKTSTLERWFLVAKRFLKPAINPSLPLKNKK